MRFFTDDDIAEALPWDRLVEAVERVVVETGAGAPQRTVHTVPVPGAAAGTFLMKPGWVTGDVVGVKAVTVFPDNGRFGRPTVQAGMLLFDATSGSLIGACEANELTTRRTAAASAVAAKRLAREDVRSLLVIGTGALAPMAARAHAHVRNYDTVSVWGRDPAKAAAVVDRLAADGLPAVQVDQLDLAVADADVISAVTGATEPLDILFQDAIGPAALLDHQDRRRAPADRLQPDRAHAGKEIEHPRLLEPLVEHAEDRLLDAAQKRSCRLVVRNGQQRARAELAGDDPDHGPDGTGSELE